MKWKRFSSIVAAGLLFVASSARTEELTEDFHEPKNIVFAGLLGESSHVGWVLMIMDELAKRGHRITFLTKDDHVRFGQKYPTIETISTGPPTQSTLNLVANTTRNTIVKLSQRNLDDWINKYPYEYTAHRDTFKKINADVVICDHTNVACVDVAYTEKIPFIVTCTAAITSDASAPYVYENTFMGTDPTTLSESFLTRFDNAFIKPLQTLWSIYDRLAKLAEQKSTMGVKMESPQIDLLWKDSVKLVNNLFGFETARALGPLVELVGPIIPRIYDPLTDDLHRFLETHRRIAFVAFGKYGTPRTSDVTLILTALLENIEKKVLDGFIWANPSSPFPPSVTTSSNTTYVTKDILSGPNARLLKWVPQQAVLKHDSVTLFVSHGGITSLYESVFAGKRLIVFPFLCDQHANAATVERNQLGARFDPKTPQQTVTQLMRKVVVDEDGVFQDSVNRFKALVQIHSRSGIKRGADLVEEVAFVSKNGKLPHRYEVSREMSFIKARNLDLYAALFLILVTPIVIAVKLVASIYSKNSKTVTHKAKTQ
ncbi:hypothetical protein EC973_007937 [Apophysomyces ossiformis]|uniref:UDP-glycosyltransferases domain-containing protein n=1 Tax=Apophysomyces ossiformis TaxID=679940 RepID=A0A8H7ETZ3_9FUNG|nr:hypothetical protein EC973_007937 [Apophysomyces ossiformis]